MVRSLRRHCGYLLALVLASGPALYGAPEAKSNYERLIGFDPTRKSNSADFGIKTTRTNQVDFSDVIGSIKPMHGVGNAPIYRGNDWTGMLHYLKEAGIPFSRLHDTAGALGGGMYVDIPNLFPNFEADENDPKSYRFGHTDVLMKGLAENGVEAIFRLGVSLEGWVGTGTGIPAERTYPPKDYRKWARICEHVIRHYTEGWNNGFKLKARYWELWNEPETAYPEKGDDMMWSASFEEYTRFYGIVMPYLKSKFPHLKMGGYGAIGFYSGICKDGGAPESTDKKHWVNFAHYFMREAKKGGWPLDFYSFHSYADSKGLCRQIRYADEMLTDYGFTRNRTERIVDEWLPCHEWEDLDTGRQAAAVASAMLGMQHGPCDIACVYHGGCHVSKYSVLFNPGTRRPRKAYWSFYAFNELYRLGKQVRTPRTPDYVNAVAATDGRGNAKIMIANDSKKSWRFDWDLGDYRIDSALLIDELTNLGLRSFKNEVGPSEVWLLNLVR